MKLQLLALAGIAMGLYPLISMAGSSQDCRVEVYRMSPEDWNHIPSAVRDDSSQLYEKCRAAAGNGKIECLDRIGGNAEAGKRSVFESISELKYATSFSSDGKILMPGSFETRTTGSTLQCELMDHATGSITYNRASLARWLPMLGTGAKGDIKRSEKPVFDSMKIAGFASGGPCLLSVMPIPAGGEKPANLAVVFALSNGPAVPSATVAGIRLEMLVLRGLSGARLDSGLIKSLLARPGAVETDIALTTNDGSEGLAAAFTEWTYPNSASRNGDVLVPRNFETLNDGTTLQFTCKNSGTTCAVTFQLTHDLRKPLISIADGVGPALVTPATTTLFRLTVKDEMQLVSGTWTAVKEVPLAPILGTSDDTLKNQSCYVFAKVLVKNGS